MKLKTSSWNNALFKHFISHTIWFSVLYLIMLLFILGIGMWLVNNNNVDSISLLQAGPISHEFLDSASLFIYPLAIIIITLMSIYLLNFKNHESSSDFMHALPIKRVHILKHALIVGILNIIVPLIITVVFIWIESMLLNMNIPIVDFIKWFLYTAFMLLVIFSINVFIGFLTNSIILHFVLVNVFFFLPILLWILSIGNGVLYFNGLEGLFQGHITKLLSDWAFPVTTIQQLIHGFELNTTIFWAVTAIVATVLAFMLYKDRRNEYVTRPFNYPIIRYVLSALVTLTGTLLVAFVLSIILLAVNSIVVYIISIIVGMLVTYIILEMVFQGTPRIQFNWVSVGITILTIAVFFTGMGLFWNNYVQVVPDEAEVAEIRVLNNPALSFSDLDSDLFDESFGYINDRAFISEMIDFHENELLESSVPFNGFFTTVSIEYTLNNGTHIRRVYSLDDAAYEQLSSILTRTSDLKAIKATDYVYHLNDQSELYSETFDLISAEYELLETYNDEALDTFIQSYREAYDENTGALMFIHPAYLPDVHISSGSAIGTLDLPLNIYNPFIIEELKQHEELSSALGINEFKDVFKVTLKDGNKQAFFNDFNESTFGELREKYDFEEINMSNEVIETINDGHLDPNSNTLIVYTLYDLMNDTDELTTFYNFYVIGVED